MNELFGRIASRILIYLLRNTNNGQINFGFKIAKEVDCTVGACSQSLTKLNRIGLIDYNNSGRMRVVKLTNKGKSIAEKLNNIEVLIT